MAYQLSDIVTKVQQRVRDTGYSTTEIKNYINDTQNDIYNEYRLPQLEDTQDYTLTISNADITSGSGLPSNYVGAINLTITTSGYEMLVPYKDYREIDSVYPDPTDTSTNPANPPMYWYFYEDTINVYPVPDKAYTATLKYYKRPTALSADADIPQLPAEFEELLVLGAAYRVLQVKDNYDQAGVLQNKYDEILDKLVMRYSQRQTGQPTRMRINNYAVRKSEF